MSHAGRRFRGGDGGVVPAGRTEVYLPGSAGEPVLPWAALAAQPETSRRFAITSTTVPGINRLPLDMLDPFAVTTGLFMQSSLRALQRENRFRALPLSFAGFVQHVRERLMLDTCVVQAAPPDADGRCSLGAAVEFTAVAASWTSRISAILNPAIPGIPRCRDAALRSFRSGRGSRVRTSGV